MNCHKCKAHNPEEAEFCSFCFEPFKFLKAPKGLDPELRDLIPKTRQDKKEGGRIYSLLRSIFIVLIFQSVHYRFTAKRLTSSMNAFLLALSLIGGIGIFVVGKMSGIQANGDDES
jgi:hypothetical protein